MIEKQAWLSGSAAIKVPIKSITVVSGRGRKVFERIAELSESIKEKGLINPLLVSRNPDKPDSYILIAGERRYRASILAGLVEIPVTFGDGLTSTQQKILELEENIERRDLSALEEAELMRQIDELRRTDNPNWTQRNTAELVDKSQGHVSLQINVAKVLNANPGLREQVKHLDIRSAMKVIERNEQVEKMERLQSQGRINPTVDLRFGSCVDLLKTLPDNHAQLCITDPPYGAGDYNVLRTSGYSPGAKLMSDTHNMTLDVVLKLMGEVGTELMRVLAPASHLYVFVPQQYLTKFIDAFEACGFEYQYPPLIWLRSQNTTPGYGYNYMNRTEMILFFHKPPREKRLAKNMLNVFEAEEVQRRGRQFHTEKPQSLLRTFIEQSSILGDRVIDPFSGSAATLIAARDLGRSAVGFEIDEHTYKRSMLRINGKEEDSE